MTISTTRELVEQAGSSGQAILAFNVISLEYAEGIVAGAERASAPVILQVSERAVRYHSGMAPLLSACHRLAEAAHVPVALHLDHFQDLELIEQGIRLGPQFGASSIMLDFSLHPHDGNVSLTSDFARSAHEQGLWVEAELGEIGGKDGAHAPGVRTDPVEAREFVALTRVDGLAVAVGSSHAMTSKDAQLDLALIADLAAAVPAPLVLHGSSGVSTPMLLDAVAAGIRKVNVGTALSVAFSAAVRSFLAQNPSASDPRGYLGAARDAVALEVSALTALFTKEHHD
jgi:fructose-bisphosphate aldolase, class II